VTKNEGQATLSEGDSSRRESGLLEPAAAADTLARAAEPQAVRRRGGKMRPEVWVSDLVFGFRLDPCHDLLEFIGQLGTCSH
jgi:hypothetical protein